MFTIVFSRKLSGILWEVCIINKFFNKVQAYEYFCCFLITILWISFWIMSFHLSHCLVFLRVFTSTLYSLLSILIVIFFVALHFLLCFCRKQIHCSCNGSVACLARHFVALFLLLLHDCKLRLLSINHATIIYGVLMCVVCAAACICDCRLPPFSQCPWFPSLSLYCTVFENYFSVFDFSLWNTHFMYNTCVCFSVLVAVFRCRCRRCCRCRCLRRCLNFFIFSFYFYRFFFIIFFFFFLLCTHSMRFFVLHAF